MTSEVVIDDASISAPATPAPHDASNAARNRLVLGLLLVSTFVVFLNETIMSVAIPHLMGDLGVTASAAQWLTTAFLLTMAIVIPVTGFLLQRINTRPIFMLAMSTFAAGTLICAVSPGLELLVLGRVVQATGTAIGGFILQNLEWRWIFILVLPIAVAALILGALRIKNVSTTRYAPLDYLSVVLSALAFGGLVYGISSIGEAAEAVPAFPAWLPIAVGAVAMVLFILRQLSLQKADKALLDLRTFGSKNYSVSVVMMAVAMMSLFGTVILLPIYLQNVLGQNTQTIGLMLLPGGLLMGLLGPTVGRLYDKIGPTPLLVPGTILVSAVMWALTLVDQNTSIWAILIGHVAISVGLALVFTPLFTASMSSVGPQFYSHASAILGSVQQVAGAAGVALFVAVMTAQTAALAAAEKAGVEALSGGIRSAFLIGAVISLLPIVCAFFVKKPAAQPGMEGMGGH